MVGATDKVWSFVKLDKPWRQLSEGGPRWCRVRCVWWFQAWCSGAVERVRDSVQDSKVPCKKGVQRPIFLDNFLFGSAPSGLAGMRAWPL